MVSNGRLYKHSPEEHNQQNIQREKDLEIKLMGSTQAEQQKEKRIKKKIC